MNRKKRSNASTKLLSGSLVRRYLFTMLLFAVGTVLLYFLGYVVCATLFVWQPDSSLYRFLQIFAHNPLETILVTWFVGGLLISAVMIIRPMRYVDEVVLASEQLTSQSEEPIRLSAQMKSVEDRLNLIKSQSLRNAALAKEAEQRKNDLIVYLAHDLKTPLTSVIGYLTLLRDEPQLSPDLRCKYTGIALEKAERLESLINEFFEITRFNLSHLSLETCPVDLVRMLQQVTSEFMPIFSEKDLACRLDLPQKLDYVCDPDKLARVFDNLLRNAVNYSSPGSTIQISAWKHDGFVTLTFINQGKTIPQEKLNRIFDQFFRLDAARGSNTGGAGLGLAIAKQIVELHSGTIAAQSSNNYVTFTISLPLQPAAFLPQA